MKVKLFLCALAIFVAGAWTLAPSAGAITSNPQCVQDAKDERNLCIFKCQEEFRVDKDTCRNIDHDCADQCREGFETCVDPFLTALSECKADCLAILEDAKTVCRNLYIAGSAERDTCIDGAQVAAFMCKDQCRENIAPSLKACRIAFRACIRDCPPAPAP